MQMYNFKHAEKFSIKFIYSKEFTNLVKLCNICLKNYNKKKKQSVVISF